MVGLWAQWVWGTSIALTFFVWRVAVYFRAGSWIAWLFEKVEDTHTMLMEADDFRGYLLDLYQERALELPIMALALIIGVPQTPHSSFHSEPSMKEHHTPVGHLA